MSNGRNNRNRMFATAVNNLLEEVLAPVLAEERELLKQKGLPDQEIERLILEVKIETQAELLPQISETVKRNLKAIEAREKQAKSSSIRPNKPTGG